MSYHHFLISLSAVWFLPTCGWCQGASDDPLLQGRPLTDWVKDLESKESRTRNSAIALMGALGPKAREHVSKLRLVAREVDPATRLALANALGRIGGDEAFGVLLLLQWDKEPNVQAAVAAAQRAICPTPGDRARALVIARTQRDREISNVARTTFGHFGPGKKEAIPTLVGLLSHPDPLLRRAACEELQAFGADAEEAVPALTNALDDRVLRLYAATALGTIVRKPETAVPAVARLFATPTTAARERVVFAWTLKKYGPQARAALPELRQAFTDTDANLRQAAAIAVAHIDVDNQDALRVLSDILTKDSDPRRRRSTAQALAELGPRAKEALPAVTQAVDDDDQTVRNAAQIALLRIGSASSRGPVALVQGLTSDTKRHDAFLTLTQLPTFDLAVVKALMDLQRGTESEAAASADLLMCTKNLDQPEICAYLLRCFTDPHPRVRARSVIYAQRVPSLEKEIPRQLAKAAGHRDAIVRLDAVKSLYSSYSRTPIAKVAFATALQDQDQTIRICAAMALASRPDRQPELLPILTSGLNNKDPQVQMWAVEGVRMFREATHGVVPLYRQWLLGNDPAQVQLAAAGLLAAGPAAKEALGDIISVLPRQQGEVRLNLLRTLGRLGPDAKSAIPVLQRLCNDAKDKERLEILHTWLEIAPDSSEVLSPLLNLLQHTDPHTRAMAVRFVGKHKKLPPEALQRLAAALKDSNFRVREAAAQSLGKLGPAAQSVIPELVAALGQPYNGTNYVAWALKQQGPPAIPALQEALQHADNRVQLEAALLLLPVDGPPPDPLAVKTLTQLARSATSLTRMRALAHLVVVDTEGNIAAPIYVEALQAEEPGVRSAAFQGLRQLGTKARPWVPALQKLLPALSSEKRLDAALALAWVAESPNEGVSAAQGILREKIVPPDPKRFPLRAEAVRRLGELGPRAKEAVPMLIECVADPGLCHFAIEALGQIGPAAKPAIPCLEGKLLDRTLGNLAVLALLRIDSRHAGALALCRRQLRDENQRLAFIRTLRVLGPNARELLPDLRSLEDVPDEEVALAVRDALANLAQTPKP
jgi:HEAT repeat protein